ncbi:MAG: hypothetical protein QME96_18915, partial [Myxococcota bacterium]|nr:hypothetical protein [Myxococcota bacterium]
MERRKYALPGNDEDPGKWSWAALRAMENAGGEFDRIARRRACLDRGLVGDHRLVEHTKDPSGFAARVR